MKKFLFILIASVLLCGSSVHAQSNYTTHWPDFHYQEVGDNYFILQSYVELNDNLITEDFARYELAAFVGEEVRGTAFMKAANTSHQYPWASLKVYFETSGETVSFQLYDHYTETLYTYCEHGNYTTGNTDYFNENTQTLSYFNTFEKEIIGYSDPDAASGYYLIASPLAQPVQPTNVTNMTSNSYDLYAFDQNAEDGLEWRNYKQGTFETLEPGKGYLYANSATVTLTFIGAPYSDDGQVSLVKDASQNQDGGFEGWNLVGNPYPERATPDMAFYVMKADGSEIITAERTYVEPMEGIFVVATEDGQTMTFNPTTSNQGKSLYFNVKANGNVIDRAVVRLEGSTTLPKIMLNPNHTKLYIPQADQDYAVTSINRDMEGEMPLSFKAAQNGTYTLSVVNEADDLEYLTLLDHKTGMQANLLLTPNYQFSASVNDAADRFTVFFRSTTGLNEQFNPILYRNNGLLTVSGLEGEYELQVVDVLGRILSSTTVNGEYSHMMDVTPGLYTIRLLNADKTYTKKIVVD